MTDTLGRILPPPGKGFYPEREADLADALRQGVMALGPNADVQRLVEAAFRAGWGLTEIHRIIALLCGHSHNGRPDEPCWDNWARKCKSPAGLGRSNVKTVVVPSAGFR